MDFIITLIEAIIYIVLAIICAEVFYYGTFC